ncbi:MoxR-like ATPase [Roseimicrobium gellanilyticum]|uniref:MoxR-like ATPase n=1 Tax=Roseimicrobium gellanilyticum TaxID=748857 RepID=A0A366HRR6_9BACT|nr:MoxR family ATPase [Roseimicrobium gellanilyticum]RBP45949.1 MoxR-like ATPase [Roseimicrobium gellanilyticum]
MPDDSSLPDYPPAPLDQDALAADAKSAKKRPMKKANKKGGAAAVEPTTASTAAVAESAPQAPVAAPEAEYHSPMPEVPVETHPPQPVHVDVRTLPMKPLEDELEEFRALFGKLKAEMQKAIVGYDDLLTETLIAIFAGGHVLLEGVPGLGKTFLVRVLSQVVGLEPGRVQCTPDLMPADILGTHIVNEDAHGRRVLHFERGPVFKNLLLVDEINRATPKTQAALLEVMQERAVTAGGERHRLPEPFFVLATQNPMEMEGTYPLPEAQLDRFMFKIKVPFPNLESLVEISRRTTGFDEPHLNTVLSGVELMRLQYLLTQIPVADPIASYASQLVLGTHPDQAGALPAVGRYVSYGASPRGLQALIRGARVWCAVRGGTAVGTEDVQRIAHAALRHRVILNFEGEAQQVKVDGLVDDLLKQVGTPAAMAA